MSSETKPEKTVRVYNRNPHRTIIHDVYKLAPSSFLDVPKSVADRWFSMFQQDVVEAGVAQKELLGAQGELSALREAHEKLLKEHEALKAKVDPKGALAQANARVAELEAQLKAKSDPKSAL